MEHTNNTTTCIEVEYLKPGDQLPELKREVVGEPEQVRPGTIAVPVRRLGRPESPVRRSMHPEGDLVAVIREEDR